MRFSLQDVKKQVQRRGGELYVSLHFLRPAELHADIERLIEFHERHIGLQHRQFSVDEARTMIADYRLANCLLATLSAWYTWQQPDWKETLSHLGNDSLNCLEEAGITSPIYLRLALFNYINEGYSGFLDAQQRSEVLQAFAAPYGLSISDLEYLLALDNESEAVLARETPHSPSVQEVAALYNQWTFEAALFNASDAHFAIDCQAFIQAQKAEEPSHTPAAGIGSVIKRLCFLARKLGVYYDLAYDTERVGRPPGIAPTDDTGGRPPGIASTDNTERIHLSENNAAILHLTLYGPQEMTGAPQQYGLRLARLCRMILGYGSARPAGANHRSRPGLIGAVREAEATVHFLQRSYHFAMNSDLLKLLPSETTSHSTTNATLHPHLGTSPSNPVGADLSRPSPIHRLPVDDHPSPDVFVKNHSRSSSIFDSSIEQSFSEAFVALANSQAADGWQLEREPEPLLLNAVSRETSTQSIFIPDFAMTRGSRRIYVEILGFWTPSYRERKIARLQQLKERDDLVLAIPVEARAAFAAIASDFPIVKYDGQLSATELLQVLRNHYDDVEERLAGIDVEMVRARIIKEGLLPERVCFELLHCYRRSELQRAAQRIVTATIAFTAGVGLYPVDWLEHLKVSFVEWIGSVTSTHSAQEIPLQEALLHCRLQSPVLQQCEDAAIEALISLWPEVSVSRSSIFDAAIHLVNNMETEADAVGADLSRPAPIHRPSRDTNDKTHTGSAPRKQVRERRATYKKNNTNQTIQGDLWG